MPTQTFPANTYLSFEYNFHRIGTIKFYVESEFPIDTFIVDMHGYNEFQSGREYTTYGGFNNREEHRQELRVPYEGYWYLIIHNPQPNASAVHYEVYE